MTVVPLKELCRVTLKEWYLWKIYKNKIIQHNVETIVFYNNVYKAIPIEIHVGNTNEKVTRDISIRCRHIFAE